MSDPTYAEASTAKSQTEFRTATLATLASPPAPLQPAPVAGWSDSAPQRILVEDFSANMAVESKIRAAIASTISPQQAVAAGADWVRACIGWFDEDYIPAQPATFDVPFQVLPTSAPVTVGASTVLQIQATGGQIYLCTQSQDVLFSSGSSYLGTLRFTARTAGAAGNVAPSTILSGKILTGPAGLSLGPGTPTQITSGRDIETPFQAIKRCLGKWARLGAGWTRQAFDYLIPTAAPGVTRWYVDDANPYGPGTTGVFIAGASGPSQPAEVTAVQTYLNSKPIRALGSGAVTVNQSTSVAFTVTASIATDGSNPTLVADASAALQSLAGAILGPAIVRPELLQAIIMGGRFSGPDDGSGVPTPALFEIPVPGGGVVEIELALPGFAGAAGIVSIGSVPDAPLLLAAGEVLNLTPVLSTVLL